MPVAYNVGANRLEVTGFALGAECGFIDLWNADKAGTLSLHVRVGVAAVDGAPVAIDRAERPTDYVVLGGASNDLYIIVANWNLMTNATINIVGTDRDGAAQNENIVVNANGNYSTTLWFKTITTTQITVFNTPGGGTFDYDLTQGQWGVVWKQGATQFFLDAQLYMNDAVGWFADTLKQVTFAAGSPTPAIAPGNGTFRLGTLQDLATKRTSHGCDMYWERVAGNGLFIFADFADCFLYSTAFASASYSRVFFRGRGGAVSRVWNSSLKANMDYTSLLAGADFYRVNLSAGTYGFRSTQGSTFNDVFSTDNGLFAIYPQNYALTIRGLHSEGNPTAIGFNALVVDHCYFIDCVLSAWTFSWVGGSTKNAYRQYSFNLKVVDSDGTGIQSVTVAMVDRLDAAVFSVATDANGDIAEQTISYGYYDTAHGNVIEPGGLGYSPHTVTISKAGYAPRTIVYTIDRPHVEVEKLGGAAPHGREYRRRRVPGEVSALDEYE